MVKFNKISKANFNTVLMSSSAVSICRRFSRIVGFEKFRKRIERIANSAQNNSWRVAALKVERSLEIEIKELVSRALVIGHIKKTETESQARALDFIFSFVQLHDLISEVGKNRLVGMFYDSLNNNRSILSLESELKVLIYLVNSDYRILPNDLENGGGFDFLVESPDGEMEVEVKTFTIDAGNSIHTADIKNFSDYFHQKINNFINNEPFVTHLHLLFEAGLPKSNDDLKSLADNVEIALSGKGDIAFDEVTISVKRQSSDTVKWADILDRARTDNSFLRRAVQTELKLGPLHTLIVTRGKAIFVTSFESKKKSEVVTRIYKELKSASAKQLTGRRPGVLVSCIAGLTQPDLVALSNSEARHTGAPNGLQLLVSQLMARAKATHVSKVVFESTDRIYVPTKHGFQESRTYYAFENGGCCFQDASEFSIYSK